MSIGASILNGSPSALAQKNQEALSQEQISSRVVRDFTEIQLLGFKVQIEDGNTLMTDGKDTSGVRRITRTVADKNHKLYNLRKLSDRLFAVEYIIEAQYWGVDKPITGQSSIQIMTIDSGSGNLVPVQEISEGEGATLRIFSVSTKGDLLVKMSQNKLNVGEDWIVYRFDKKDQEYKKIKTVLQNVYGASWGESEKFAGEFYIMVYSDGKDSLNKIYRINPEKGTAKLVLKGRAADKNVYMGSEENISKVFSDVFIAGYTKSHSADVQEINIFSALDQGEFKKIGTVTPRPRDMVSYHGKVTPLAQDLFVVKYDHSTLSGESIIPAHLRTYSRDFDLHIISIKGDKIQEQYMNLKDSFTLSNWKAVGLSVHQLNQNEFFLYGRNQIQILRKSNGQFKVEELIYFEEDESKMIDGSRMKINLLSDTEFEVYDGEGLVKTRYRVSKSGGKYKFKRQN